jgi:hypothetical protein
VVGCHPGPDEAERGREAVVQVDLVAGLEQRVGGVEAGRTGAENGNAYGNGGWKVWGGGEVVALGRGGPRYTGSRPDRPRATPEPMSEELC